MTLRRTLTVLVLALLGVSVLAEVGGNSAVSVTATSQSVTFSKTYSSVTLINDSASAKKYYARLFNYGDTIAAATTSSPIRLEPGESHTFTVSDRTECGSYTAPCGYTGVSFVCASSETATARWTGK